MIELDATIKEFLVESTDNVEQFDQALLVLESNSSDYELINKMFRINHTIKGTCGFFDFTKLERLCHGGENLLDSIRSRRVNISQEIISVLLQLSDTFKIQLAAIENTGTEGALEDEALMRVLCELNQSDATTNGVAAVLAEPLNENKEAEAPTAVIIPAPSEAIAADDFELLFAQAQAQWKSENEDVPVKSSEQKSEAEPPSPTPTIAADDFELLFAQAQAQYKSENDGTPEIHSELESEVAPPSPSPVRPTPGETQKSELVDTNLRVDINLLDKLMNLVGELVLARNQILQFTKSSSDAEFADTSQRLNLITSELQDGVMRTRMQPIATVWNKLPRIVRDISHSCGKQVKLEMFGKETELDKTIIEAIKDPLTHVIRNAVDHGIEKPAVRVAAGKCADGRLTMKAFHEGGQVIIEIFDDGAGLNTQRIKAKALEKGLITSQKAALMSDSELNRLIFLPGFSTAEQVTNISGRGVGMDVVRSNIERIGGAVDVTSQFGNGCKFTFKIPLTLAIIPALMVATNQHRYAIPQVNLLELVRIEGDSLIEHIQGSDFYRLRGKILPLVYLDKQFERDGARKRNTSSEKTLNLVVVRADDHQFGLVVDSIHDSEEIVVKPLGRLLKGIPMFAGATIMGDGQVALILDIAGLARKAEIAKKESVRQHDIASEAREDNRRKMFIFDLGNDRRAAVPLEQVYRLEEFEVAKFERAGGLTAIQYRNGILPLIDLRRLYADHGTNTSEIQRAFVHCAGEQFVGFLVDRIVDIVEQSIDLQTPFKREGIIGSAVLQQKVTDLLDLESILRVSGILAKTST